MQHSNSNLKLITIVIPCLNEQQSISTLYYELKNVQKEMPRSYRWETLFVDDGSNDQSLDIIKRLCQTDASVKYISLSRNFGHNNALIAGITHAKGDAVITLDCDLQHPPCLIKKMIAVWSQGYDVINMVRKGTVSNSWFKSYSAHCFYLDVVVYSRYTNTIDSIKDLGWIGAKDILYRKAFLSLNLGKALTEATYYANQYNAMHGDDGTWAVVDHVPYYTEIYTEAYFTACEKGGTLPNCKTSDIECEPLDVVS